MRSKTAIFAVLIAAGFTLVPLFSTPAQAQFDSIFRNALGAAIQQGLQQQQQRQAPQLYYQPQHPQINNSRQSSYGPSFNCRGRTNPVELAICNDTELSQLDRSMADAFVARLRQGGGADELKAEQAQWRSQRDLCQDRDCIKRSMLARTEQLGGNGNVVFSPSEAGATTPDSDDLSADGLELPSLPMLQGVPILGFSPSSVDGIKWFMLVNLSVNPGLVDKEPQLYASRFLNQNSQIARSDAWQTSNEFAQSDIREAFLKEYGSRLKRAAVPLPAEIIYTQTVSLAKYDQQQQGFPIESRRSTSSLVQAFPANFDLYGDVNFDASFWPVKEATARDLFSRFRVLARHEATLAIQLHLDKSPDDPTRITAAADHAYLLNPESHQVLFNFGNAVAPAPLLPEHVASGNPFAAWTHPPKGIQPQRLTTIDGAVVFPEQGVLMQIIAAGGLPDFATRPAFAGQRAAMAHTLLTGDETSKIFWQNTNALLGHDEFDKQRAADRLGSDIANLISIAPKPPFDVTIVHNGRLHEYDRSNNGFRVDADGDLGMKSSASQAGLIVTPTFQWPDLFWPVAAADAERALQDMHGERDVKVAAHISVNALDPSTGRLSVSIRSVGLFSPKGTTALYTFPVHNDQPIASAPTLAFRKQPKLDEMLICAIVLSSKSRPAMPRAVQECMRVVADRDARTYGDPVTLDRLIPTDAEFPFFPRGGTPSDQVDQSQLADWAGKFALAARGKLIRYEHHISQRRDRGLAFEAVGHSDSGSGKSILRILSTYHMRPEQVVSYGKIDDLPIYLATPNLAELYSLVVPFSLLNKDTSGGNPVAELELKSSVIENDDAGQPVLVLNVVPHSLVVNNNAGSEIMETSFSDVDSINAGPADHSGPRPAPALDAALIDMLTLNAIGKSMPREALAYMVERRWAYERNNNGQIDRFFQIGSLQPDPEAAAAEAESFLDWTAKHAPSLPMNVTTSGPLELTNSSTGIDWGSLPCFSSSLALLASDNSSSMGDSALIANCERKGDESTDAELSACKAAKSRIVYRSRVREIGVACRNTAVRLPFEDPFKVFISLDADQQLPQITALGGRQKVIEQVVMTIQSITGLTRNPRSGVSAEIADYEEKGDAPSSGAIRFARLNAHVANMTYRDAVTQADLQMRSPSPTPDTPTSSPLAGPPPAISPASGNASLATPSTPSSSRDLDMLGIRLGMSFETAKAIIQDHMKVGSVLQGARAYDAQQKQGFIKPVSSGELFVSDDGKEMIALIDEPPAAPNRVLLAWRRVYVPTGTVAPGDLDADTRQKYGLSSGRGSISNGGTASWSPAGGLGCSGFYETTRQFPLADSWGEDGAPNGPRSTSMERLLAPRMPVAFFDPLKQEFSGDAKCGPTVTVTFGKPGGSSDEIDTLLEDFGTYTAAFASSRHQLQRDNPATAAASHVKF